MHYSSLLRIVDPMKANQKQLQSFHSSDYICYLETHSNQSESDREEEEMSEEMEAHGLGTWGHCVRLSKVTGIPC